MQVGAPTGYSKKSLMSMIIRRVPTASHRHQAMQALLVLQKASIKDPGISPWYSAYPVVLWHVHTLFFYPLGHMS
jgi:hypothetical protein